MTLVDSNVLLDVIQNDPKWSDWSASALAKSLDDGPVIVNPIVFAEVALAFDTQQKLDAYFRPNDFERRQLPWKAAMLVARAFLRYRRSGGAKNTPLPDFYIGAHAEHERLELLTRDATRYRTYFPKVRLITPN